MTGSGWLAALVIAAVIAAGGGIVLPPASPLAVNMTSTPEFDATSTSTDPATTTTDPATTTTDLTTTTTDLVAATTPPRAPATLASVCLPPRYCGRLAGCGNEPLCCWPIFGSFTAPTIDWHLAVDSDCCYDSDNDGALDTNYNPGGMVGMGGGGIGWGRHAYIGWPKSRSSAWGNCSRACWDNNTLCVSRPETGCNPARARPVCAAASPADKGSGGDGSGGSSDDDYDDNLPPPEQQPRSTEAAHAVTFPATAQLCDGKRDPKFCMRYDTDDLASKCEVWELNTSCPVLCNACPKSTPAAGKQADGGATSTTARSTVRSTAPGGGAMPPATPAMPTAGPGHKGAGGKALVWAGAGAGTILIAFAAGWFVYQQLRRRESTRIKAGRLSVSADRPGHVAMNAAFVEDIELDIEDDDDDDALAVFDGTDAVQFDGRVRQHGELTFTPQSEL